MASTNHPPSPSTTNNHTTTPTASTNLEAPWSVSTALGTLSHPPTPNPSSPVPFFHLLERLKTTPREGWRRFGISHGESIADHMYRMSILTMLCPPDLAKQLDIPRCTKMALVHDMAESLVGDITPQDKVLKKEKNRREGSTMDFLTTDGLLGAGSGAEAAGQGIRDVWQEYEDGKTLEAKFVHDVDKMELVLQMLEYERSNHGRINLEEFLRVARKIELEEVQKWCDEVLSEREEYWASIGRPEVGQRTRETVGGQVNGI